MTRRVVSSLKPFVLPFIVALGIRSVAVWFSHGQSVVDVASFQRWAEHLDRESNPYTATTYPANYPPLWVYLCWACLVTSRWISLSFDLVLKLFVSLCDAATVVPVGLLAASHGSAAAARAASFAYAVNPVAILIAAFHGQNDPVAVGLILWSFWLITVGSFPGAAAVGSLVLGVSLCIKPIGVLVLPLVLAHLAGWGQRVLLFALTWLPMVLTAVPYLIESPLALGAAARTYRGSPDFGYVGIYNAWMNFGHGSSGEPIVRSLPLWLRLAGLGVLVLVWYQFRRAALLEQTKGIILGLYLAYGSLGAQYLMWIVPLAAATRDRHLLRCSILASLALLAFYQLNHPAILTGSPGVQWKTGIQISQWTGILFMAQLTLYVVWFRWMRALIMEYERRHPDQWTVDWLVRRLRSLVGA